VEVLWRAFDLIGRQRKAGRDDVPPLAGTPTGGVQLSEGGVAQDLGEAAPARSRIFLRWATKRQRGISSGLRAANSTLAVSGTG
jgi:hypothetical protein